MHARCIYFGLNDTISTSKIHIFTTTIIKIHAFAFTQVIISIVEPATLTKIPHATIYVYVID